LIAGVTEVHRGYAGLQQIARYPQVERVADELAKVVVRAADELPDTLIIRDQPLDLGRGEVSEEEVPNVGQIAVTMFSTIRDRLTGEYLPPPFAVTKIETSHCCHRSPARPVEIGDHGGQPSERLTPSGIEAIH
jgi:hypothetical protein